MSKLAERIAANRAARQRSSIEVEEWGEDGNPLVVYFGPLTARDIDKISRKHQDFLVSPSMGAMVEAIIIKAEDAEGDKLFTLEDKTTLMGEPVTTIAKVFGQVMESATAEDHAKNSDATHSG